MFLLDFGMGTMLANCHMCGIMWLLRAVFVKCLVQQFVIYLGVVVEYYGSV